MLKVFIARKVEDLRPRYMIMEHLKCLTVLKSRIFLGVTGNLNKTLIT
ncbi:hypothetical protein CTER_3872 [Ruminiclostridium cellobioparum subsp. termitidis CT1112]|uniref:Uncharacterized protein n=1 Tax=Ruminiclostridium cellobioparum subsp. termitidis CT1112 TaxID=1195236 RepID=S0FGS1_RUMCE|nr:hypothetical protein CTER_3872 [Ruminiclostridium cellobioparum subsp. termitidis CT1112]